MWHYLFFMHGILKKDKSELSGQESHVWMKMKAKEPNFFPIGRAMMLQADKLDDHTEEEETLQRYEEVMDASMMAFVDQFQTKMGLLTDRLEKLEKDLSSGVAYKAF
jgi:hypothetical protein